MVFYIREFWPKNILDYFVHFDIVSRSLPAWSHGGHRTRVTLSQIRKCTFKYLEAFSLIFLSKTTIFGQLYKSEYLWNKYRFHTFIVSICAFVTFWRRYCSTKSQEE